MASLNGPLETLVRLTVASFYSDLHVVAMDALLELGGRALESEVAARVRLPVKRVREALAEVRVHGLIRREAHKKEQAEVENPEGAPEEAWRTQSSDSYCSVDFDRFVKVTKFRTSRMREMLNVRDRRVETSYVCPREDCRGRGKVYPVLDALHLHQRMMSEHPELAEKLAASFVCPYEGCDHAGLVEAADPVRESIDNAEKLKLRMNEQLQALFKQLRVADKFLAERREELERLAAEETFSGPGRSFGGRAGGGGGAARYSVSRILPSDRLRVEVEDVPEPGSGTSASASGKPSAAAQAAALAAAQAAAAAAMPNREPSWLRPRRDPAVEEAEERARRAEAERLRKEQEARERELAREAELRMAERKEAERMRTRLAGKGGSAAAASVIAADEDESSWYFRVQGRVVAAMDVDDDLVARMTPAEAEEFHQWERRCAEVVGDLDDGEVEMFA